MQRKTETRGRAKSYWQSMSLRFDESKDACRAWFAPLADDLTPYKAEVLCDVETDREKKLRAFMTNERGEHYMLTRSRGTRNTVITMKRIYPEAVTNAA